MRTEETTSLHDRLMRAARSLALLCLAVTATAPAHADQITDNARAIWRDWTVDGVPSSGLWSPRKSDQRTWGALVGSSITALQAGQSGAALAFDTKANLDASLAYAANTQAFVYADGTPANNGIYAKVGASGTGSWTKLSALVYGPTPTFALGTVTITACNTSPAAALGGTALAPVLDLSFPSCNYDGAIPLPTPTTTVRGGVLATTPVAHQWVTGVNTATGDLLLTQPALADIAPIAANSMPCNATGAPASPTACTTLPSGLTIPGATLTGATLQSIAAISGVLPSPDWATYTTQWQPAVFNVGDLPITSMFSGFTTGFYTSGGQATALIGAIDTPSTDTALLNPGSVPGNVNVGIQGVARSASTVKGSVGVFGGGMPNANNVQSWAFNGVATNWNSLSGTTLGYDLFYSVGSELDVYINDTGTGTPHGTAIGQKIVGHMQSVPLGGAYGIEIAPANVAGTLGWSCAICIDDAPSTYAISIGSAGAGTDVSSQLITFKSIATGVAYQSSIYADQFADLVLSGHTNVISTVPLVLNGATSGFIKLQVPAVAGINTITLPAGTTDFSATGGTSQVVKQTALGGAFTVGQLSANDISNGVTGSGAVVLATSPSFVTPSLGVATATSINRVALTAPATSATLTLADGSTLATSGAFSTTLTSTATTVATLPAGTHTLSGLDVAETFSATKTFSVAPIFNVATLQAKVTASSTAPGASTMKLEVVAGTNAGTCKLQAYAGTSTTPVTVVDNVGSGC